MGKKQHSKDRMFLTRTEWNRDWGGHKKRRVAFSTLPFHCCALSFQPFQDPVCTPDGFVFDLTNAVPYVRQHKKHPVTGEKLSLSELTPLKFHKNLEGDYWCPVLNKVFTESTHIVAIKTTGNVYCYEAVQELCLKAKNYKDLLTEEPFKEEGKKDIVHLHDPKNLTKRQIDTFYSVKHNNNNKNNTSAIHHHGVSGAGAGAGAGDIRVVSEDSRRILQSLGSSSSTSGRQAKDAAEEKRKEKTPIVRAVTHSTLIKGSAKRKASSDGRDADALTPPKERQMLPKMEKGVSSTGAVSRSFTSTSVEVRTVNDREVVRKEYNPKKGHKGYVRLQTSHGNLNLELHCDFTPRTCENFLSLCESHYYDKTLFHRSIPGFMIQGGDPSGTGRGGESIYGGTFKDEIDQRVVHNARGVVAMANRGRDTNTSQFYICYAPCSHLNYKHTVFGKVVGGMQTLDAMEAVPTGEETDRPKEPIVLESCVVFTNPFKEMMHKEEEEEREKQQRERKRKKEEKEEEEEEQIGKWYSNPGGFASSSGAHGGGGGIGKYLKRPASTLVSTKNNVHVPSSKLTAPPPPEKKKNKQGAASYGNFSNW